MTEPVNRPAVFLDRDGTLIREVDYLTDPEDVELLTGVATALRRLRSAGFACIVVTNQSAIARGLLSESGLAAIHARLETLLAASDAHLDGIYFCPDGPDSDRTDQSGEGTALDPQSDRKPGAGMLLRAARDHRLDLASSWMVGDHARDLQAGRNAGCKGSILVRTGHGRRYEAAVGIRSPIVDDLGRAAQLILETVGA